MKVAKLLTPWTGAFLLMTIGLTFGMSAYPLLDPDEGRNAEIAREMAETNDYILPRLNGLPYLDKPVIFFATTAVSMEVMGNTELAARVAPLLFTCLTLLVVWLFANQLCGKAGACIATVATGTMPLTLAFARTVIFDSTLTFFVTVAIAALYLAIETKDQRATFWMPVAFLSIGMGILTKGPIALALPLMVAAPYAIWRRQGRRLLDPLAWLVLIAVTLPWVAAVSREVPDFFRYVVFTETAGRFFTDELRRTGPLWYFVPILLAGSLPWSLIAIIGWRSAGADSKTRLLRDHRIVFFLLWIAVPLLFFSLSQSKRPQYVLPLLPAIGLLVAQMWTIGAGRPRGARGASLAMIVVAAVLASAPIIVTQLLDVTPAISAAVVPTSIGLAAATFMSALGVWMLPQRTAIGLTMFSIPAAAIPTSSVTLMKAIGADRSSYSASVAIRPLLRASTEIITIDTYPLSLPFYLERTFTLATSDGSELTSNYLTRSLDRFRRNIDTPLRPADWWLNALTRCSRPRIFITASENTIVREALGEKLGLIVETDRMAAYGPCATEALALDSEPKGHTKNDRGLVSPPKRTRSD